MCEVNVVFLHGAAIIMEAKINEFEPLVSVWFHLNLKVGSVVDSYGKFARRHDTIGIMTLGK